MTRVAASLVLAACAAAAVRAADRAPVYGAEPGGPSILLPYVNGASPYSGVGRYAGRAACTAFFLDTAPARPLLRDAPAYALTSGRCAAPLGAADRLLNRAGMGRVTFHDFADAPIATLDVAVERIVYATARGHDIALIELGLSYRALRTALVRPLPVAAREPSAGEPVAIVGAPVLQEQHPFLRLARCRLEGIAPLVMEHVWSWHAAAFNRCQDVRPGSAGSPVISMVDGTVVALVSTTRTGSAPEGRCGSGHPCEPDGAGSSRSRPDTTYTSSVTGIARCFNAQRHFDLHFPGCPLDAHDPSERIGE